MLGTEFEELSLAEPQVVGLQAGGVGYWARPRPRRVLVLGAGVGGIEAARLAAACGHTVEVWERAARPGGQMHLAVAAPDKAEVWPAWTYRRAQVEALNVPVRCSVEATAAMIRDFRPDHVIVATGARPRPFALPGGVSLQAWDVIATPDLMAEGATVAIIGGGIVGLEVADMLALRGCRLTVLEAMPSLAPLMARNNRTDLLLRLRTAGVVFHTGARVQGMSGNRLEFTVDGVAHVLDGVDHVIAAIGAVPNRDAVPDIEAAGVPYTLVGDANLPGDFLSVLRDASMAGLAIGLPLGAA